MNILYSALVLTVWFMSTFFTVSMLLIVLEKKRAFTAKVKYPPVHPKVSIILPAYNEENGILPALDSLAKIKYPSSLFEIIVVNDGSKDGTSKIVRDFISQNKNLDISFIDRKENKGKSFSLNEGIRMSKGEFVGCMDGDSIVQPGILSKIVGYFNDPKVASVSVKVNVREPKSLLEKIVDVEYAVGLSISLKILSMLDSMHVTPGPFSIYRKSVLLKLGGFDEKNITEDLEIAFRLQEHGYKLAFCLSTSVSTKVPSTLNSLYKQRKRWYSGSILTVLQHKELLFDRRMNVFGFFLPFNYSLIFFGMSLFLYSLYLYATKFITGVNHLRLVNFDILSSPLTFNLDLLSVDIFTTLALSMIVLTIILTKVSFNAIHRKVRENITGFIGFLFFFILYQFFWLGSFYAVVRGREIKWR